MLFEGFDKEELLLDEDKFANLFKGEGAIYAVVCEYNANEFPIYIGQASSLKRRMGEYDQGHFSASTDFKVRAAIRHLKKLGCRVHLKYKHDASFNDEGIRLEKERECIINALVHGHRLLNAFPSYNYKNPEHKREQIQDAIEKFCNHYVGIK